MEREKPNFDILGRIDRERLARVSPIWLVDGLNTPLPRTLV